MGFAQEAKTIARKTDPTKEKFGTLIPVLVRASDFFKSALRQEENPQLRLNGTGIYHDSECSDQRFGNVDLTPFDSFVTYELTVRPHLVRLSWSFDRFDTPDALGHRGFYTIRYNPYKDSFEERVNFYDHDRNEPAMPYWESIFNTILHVFDETSALREKRRQIDFYQDVFNPSEDFGEVFYTSICHNNNPEQVYAFSVPNTQYITYRIQNGLIEWNATFDDCEDYDACHGSVNYEYGLPGDWTKFLRLDVLLERDSRPF